MKLWTELSCNLWWWHLILLCNPAWVYPVGVNAIIFDIWDGNGRPASHQEMWYIIEMEIQLDQQKLGMQIIRANIWKKKYQMQHKDTFPILFGTIIYWMLFWGNTI